MNQKMSLRLPPREQNRTAEIPRNSAGTAQPCIFPLQAEADRFHPFDRPGWIVRCTLGTEMIPWESQER
ncbi:MAG: hypothetical protein LBO79_01800, partial [Zoogloeaceae bacterium]|nr:hypothetical protein [Zoogloeaceae bacterium]